MNFGVSQFFHPFINVKFSAPQGVRNFIIYSMLQHKHLVIQLMLKRKSSETPSIPYDLALYQFVQSLQKAQSTGNLLRRYVRATIVYMNQLKKLLKTVIELGKKKRKRIYLHRNLTTLDYFLK